MKLEISYGGDKERFHRAVRGDAQERIELLKACHAPVWHFVCYVLLPRQSSLIPFSQTHYQAAHEACLRAHSAAMSSLAPRLKELEDPSKINAWVRSISDDHAFMEMIDALNSRSKRPNAAQSEWALTRVRQMAADWFLRHCERDLVEDMVNDWTIRVIKYFDTQTFDVKRGSGGIAANFQAFLF